MTGNVWWIGPLVLVVVRMLYLEAQSTRAARSGSVLIFRTVPAVRILFGFAILALSVLLFRAIGHEEWWVMAIGTGMTILLALAWPSTITVEEFKVTSVVWWRGKSTIEWNAVTDLEKNANGDMKIYGFRGVVINFTKYHVDPGRFESEVLRRAKLRGPTSANSTLSIGP